MVQISGPSGGNKRFGTLQMLVHPGAQEQCKLAMVFHGGGSVYEAEKDPWFLRDLICIFRFSRYQSP